MQKMNVILILLVVASLLCGCEILTVDQMYYLPERPESYNHLQSAINDAVQDNEYCAPLSGENRQTVQMTDLDGDGVREYLVFTKTNADMPLQILIFGQVEMDYVLVDTVSCHGLEFEIVEYVQMDGSSGMEMVVGRRLNGEVLKSVSVYRFMDGKMQQLLSTNYAKMQICDLNLDSRSELLILRPGQTEADNGVAELYMMENGVIERSNEAVMSGPTDRIKRIVSGNLSGGVPAIFVGSAVDESALITDVYTLLDGVLTNVSLSSEAGTSVQTLRNYYVYADDIDEDGEVEFPDLISVNAVDENNTEDRNYVIRWYAMGIDGSETDKMYTYHNFVGGWYLEMDSTWASRVSVKQSGTEYGFYLWDSKFEAAERIFTVYALSGQNLDQLESAQNRFVLYRTESTIYAAHLEVASGAVSLTSDDLINGFHMIRLDWKTGET